MNKTNRVKLITFVLGVAMASTATATEPAKPTDQEMGIHKYKCVSDPKWDI